MGAPLFAPVGTTGLRLDVAALVRDNVRQLLIDALHDQPGHAYAVASGQTYFREVFTREMGAFWGKDRAGADHLADTCWQFLETQWRRRYPGVSPTAFLDAISPKSPPTEAEIEDGWELEIAGSDNALRRFYEGSARTRKGRDLGGKRVNVGKVEA
jgi:hypothetical protein